MKKATTPPFLMPVSSPVLLLDEARCRRNIRRMAAKAQQCGLRFRPHAKTHQSLDVARWLREAGVSRLTVSSPAMAEYFAAGGWTDLTLAFPLNLRALDALLALAERIHLQLVVESPEHLQALRIRAKHPLDLFLLVDTGAGRTGLRPQQMGLARDMVATMESEAHLRLAGLLTHAGHSYRARGREEIGRVHRQSLDALRTFARGLPVPPPVLNVGDTPCCSTQTEYEGIHEIRPGNFVFYDLMQAQIGACRYEDIALAMACPVTALHPECREAVLHDGAVHFAKDAIRDASGRHIYGIAVAWTADGWDPQHILGRLLRLSQEHGILRLEPEAMPSMRIGDLVYVLPVHACHTADAMKSYLTLDGDRLWMMPPAGFVAPGWPAGPPARDRTLRFGGSPPPG
jgi:D-serine deaminase-like pyridoxal phosphate-dependent protein